MSLEHDMDYLLRVPILALLESEARRLIATLSETHILGIGDVLFCKGEKSDGGYVVFEGAVRLSRNDNEKQTDQIVRRCGFIGQIALISQTERTVTASALEPSVVLKITRPVFHRVLREFPNGAVRLHGFVRRNLSELSGTLETARDQILSGG